MSRGRISTSYWCELADAVNIRRTHERNTALELEHREEGGFRAVADEGEEERGRAI
jgi:hypothetical protein